MEKKYLNMGIPHKEERIKAHKQWVKVVDVYMAFFIFVVITKAYPVFHGLSLYGEIYPQIFDFSELMFEKVCSLLLIGLVPINLMVYRVFFNPSHIKDIRAVQIWMGTLTILVNIIVILMMVMWGILMGTNTMNVMIRAFVELSVGLMLLATLKRIVSGCYFKGIKTVFNIPIKTVWKISIIYLFFISLFTVLTFATLYTLGFDQTLVHSGGSWIADLLGLKEYFPSRVYEGGYIVDINYFLYAGYSGLTTLVFSLIFIKVYLQNNKVKGKQ